MPPRPATVLLTLAGLLLLWVGRAAWQRRDEPGARLFVGVTGVGGSGALAMALCFASGWSRTAVLTVAIFVSLTIPVPWLLFSFRYTGRPELVSLGNTAILGTLPWLGLLASALIFGSQSLPWMSLPSQATASGPEIAVVTLVGMIQRLALLYAGGLMLLGSGVLLWAFQRYEYLDATTGTLLGTFGTVTWLSLLLGLQVADVAPLALPWTVAAGFMIGSTAVGDIFWRRDLFQTVPAAGNVGPTTVIDEMDDVVVVTDSDGTVIDINAAAGRVMSVATEDTVGGDIDRLLRAPLDEIRTSETVEIKTETARRLFEPTVSSLTDHHDRCIGYTVVLREVTDRTTRRQRLEVLNRIIRHNLRNDLNVVLGQAEWIQRASDDEDVVGSAEMIQRTTDSLTAMAEDAAEIERRIDSAESPDRDIGLADLIGDVISSTVPDGAGVKCDTDMPGDIVVEGSRNLVELALRNLVENAVEHNDSDRPQVEITAQFDPGETYPVSVIVADNGPGIPDNEHRAVDRGTVRPLDHGSGLGLWAVRWAVTELGGTVEFDCHDVSGTSVSLRFPRGHRTESQERAGDDFDR